MSKPTPRQVYYPNWWKRIKRSLEGCRPKLSFRLCLFEEQYDLDFFGFLIALPFLDRWHRSPHEMMESWGVYYSDNSIVWCWNRHCKFWHMPWEWKHFKTEVMRPDGSFVKRVACYEKGEPDGRWQETYDYEYTLKSGEVQKRKATIYVEKMEWRRRFLRWVSLFAKVRTSIDISFDDEVGERTGSWKGGTIGCGWNMKAGETPLEALRRMEKERSFR